MIKKISIFIFSLSLLTIGIGVNLTNIQNSKDTTVELSLSSLINSAEASSENGGGDCWEGKWVTYPAYTQYIFDDQGNVIKRIQHPAQDVWVETRVPC